MFNLNLEKLVLQIKTIINQSKDLKTLELIRIKYLGKKGYFFHEMNKLRNLDYKDRPQKGAIINQAKTKIQKALFERKNMIMDEEVNSLLSKENLDISLPGRRMENGGLHPITRTIERMKKFFIDLGFSVTSGPEIEDDYHNFHALNISKNHPASSYDTFWLDSTRLLRTQTSCVQIRIMQKSSPPIRMITYGRVYRNDFDRLHTPMFHQMDGLMIDTNINFSNLKGIIYDFLYHFFEEEKLQIRFRPSYFPFTEPSAEVDVMKQDGKNNWLEILGCGMVHPNVLRNVAIDKEKFSGFAFGIGIERLAMLRYGIMDSRKFFENDLLFLKQFK